MITELKYPEQVDEMMTKGRKEQGVSSLAMRLSTLDWVQPSDRCRYKSSPGLKRYSFVFYCCGTGVCKASARPMDSEGCLAQSGSHQCDRYLGGSAKLLAPHVA